MQSMVLIAALAATFIFSFFVVRGLGRFFDENAEAGEWEHADENGTKADARSKGDP